MKHSGIDLHSNDSVVSVTDDADRVVAEKRLPILGLPMGCKPQALSSACSTGKQPSYAV
jgi:hypothetical protein